MVVEDDSSDHHSQHEQNRLLLLEPRHNLPEITHRLAYFSDALQVVVRLPFRDEIREHIT